MYHLTPTTKIPPQKVILTVTQNKAALIDLLYEDLINHKEEFQKHRLVITGSHPTPVELYKGLAIQRRDLETRHEEADTIIPQQLAIVRPQSAIVVADDTDVFVLLCHFCHLGKLSLQVWMVSPIKGRSVIDINATVAKNDDIMEDLLAMHGISGCDTVAPYYGIGKGVPLRVLRSKKHPLSALGDLKITLRKVIKECTGFILACYGEGNADSASDARYKLWMKKVSKNIARSPKLKSLPPTDEALAQNVARAHIQVAVWRNSLEANPPELDPLLHGWYNVDNGILAAVMLPPNTELAPKSLLKSIKCECKGEKPCNTRRCSCNSSVMTCGTFCNCQRVGDCWNYHTRISDTLLGNHSDEDDDDSD